MLPRPLRVFAAPRYPTKLHALASRELLEKALPAPWRRSEALSAVAGVALLAQTACGSVADQVANGRSSLVAPVSQHGEGVAGVGCVVISPPVFLSEEEALKVIQDEAGKRGLRLGPAPGAVLGTNVKVQRFAPDGDTARKAEFVPDLADRAKHVAVEFVSKSDADTRGNIVAEDGTRAWISAYRINTRQAAEELAATVQRDGTTGVYFGAFFDPAGKVHCRRSEASCQEMAAVTATASKEQLRTQVRDFLDWLQAQGAL